jgi:DNA-binding NarL/FixJ family response regulator
MKKLLITDSLKSSIEKKGDVLLREDIKIFTSSSGDEILKIHKSEDLDFIMTDLDTHGKKGDEICSIIKYEDVFKRVPIAIVCNNDIKEIERVYSCKANALIRRPVDNDTILNNINKFLFVSSRSSVRVVFHAVVKVISENKPYFANSENMSSSGMLLASNGIFKKGDMVVCLFFIGNGHVEIKSEVVRVSKNAPDKYFYGVEFNETDTKSHKIIVNYIHTFFQYNYYLSIGLASS